MAEPETNCPKYFAAHKPEPVVDPEPVVNTETYKKAHFYKDGQCYVSKEDGEDQKTCAKVTVKNGEGKVEEEQCVKETLNDKSAEEKYAFTDVEESDQQNCPEYLGARTQDDEKPNYQAAKVHEGTCYVSEQEQAQTTCSKVTTKAGGVVNEKDCEADLVNENHKVLIS